MIFEIKETGEPTIEAYSTEEFLRALIERIEKYNVNDKERFDIVVQHFSGGETKKKEEPTINEILKKHPFYTGECNRLLTEMMQEINETGYTTVAKLFSEIIMDVPSKYGDGYKWGWKDNLSYQVIDTINCKCYIQLSDPERIIE